ncbi:MAG: hypothetical protein LBI36_03080, partial [Oscillospiraceae bacterium]|nr:hypothetical protein [Oscillospiraceae bacterium]
PTINGIRGMHPKIRDRFDLTLECIRLWYIGRESPLFEHLDRYGGFFRLFGNFQGYVSFFLLEDLVSADGSILFWLPFDGFDQTNPLPATITEYREYMKNITAFAMARNVRIAETDKTLNNAEFVATAEKFMWTFAKTMPQCPHEYIVRGKTADEDTYLAMFRTIEARGEWGTWNNTPRQYLHPGDGYYYWKMTNDIRESIVINRAKETETSGLG